MLEGWVAIEWDYVMVIGNHNASSAKRWKCNFCEVAHKGIAAMIKTNLGGLQGHDIVSYPNISKPLSIFFSLGLPLMASMGNFRVSIASTNAT
jgi:hypothetical protein